MSGPTLLTKGNLIASKYSPKQSELDKFTPVEYIMDVIESKLLKPGTSVLDRIFILLSSTGSGKSTILPPESYHLFFEKNKRNIACTQPRVFNAIDVPRGLLEFHSAEFLKSIGKSNRTPLQMGNNIGFQTGQYERRPIKGIIYMTIGVLRTQLNVMSDEDFMNKYSIIFIDEAHERSNDLDNTLFLMKIFIQNNYQNPKCPILIVMSATLDTELFADYLLSSVKSKSKRYGNIIKVAGSSYPIDDRFLSYDAESYIGGTIDILVQLHEEFSSDFLTEPKSKSKRIKKLDSIDDNIFRDVAIFVSGKADYENIAEKIYKLNSSHDFFKQYPVLPLYIDGNAVATQNESFRSLFKPIDKLKVEVKKDKKIELITPSRRIIIGTPTMETGVTIETLKHVIEIGYMQTSLNCSPFGFDVLQFQPVSRDIARQRRGRVGRKHSGVAWYVYTKDIYDMLDEHPLPDVLKDSIDDMLLSTLIKISDKGELNNVTLYQLINDEDLLEILRFAKIDLYNIDLFTMPPADALHASIEKLYILGAIDSNCCVTPMGLLLNNFTKYSLESIKMIISGYAWGVSIQDLITIASFVNINSGEIFKGSKKTKYKKSLEEGEFNIFPNSNKTQFLLADEFIEGLIIFDHFSIMVNKHWPPDQNKIKQWCEDRGLLSRGLFTMIEIRDEIILGLFKLGFNPYENSEEKLSGKFLTTEIIDVVSKLKQCIFEGYKYNIAQKQYDGSYMTLKGLNKITVDMDVDANFIVVSKIMGFLDTSNLYTLRGLYTSVIDGYIPLDLYYDTLV